jgi:hypothetical protein
MIYLTGNNPGVGFHVVYVHEIWCEYDFLSGARICHLIHREKVDRKLGNMQHVLEASVGEFNPSFPGDFDRRVVPHQNRRNFACIQRRIDWL